MLLPKASTPQANIRWTYSQCPWASTSHVRQQMREPSTPYPTSSSSRSSNLCMASDPSTASTTPTSSACSRPPMSSTSQVHSIPPSPTHEENEAWLLGKGYEFPEEQRQNRRSGLAWYSPLLHEEAEERMENTRRRGRWLSRKVRMRGHDESRQRSKRKAARRKLRACGATHDVEWEK
jgi:hypothetical protein